ncbi:hypothetical protein [Bowdeniella massiliensis]|uniref:hypothetical protein n=1 Tax=Bowdeniella massiliensis TaxID=2932264 RepID=UPI0020295D99|nr:hypothetical protein [Bowdeniella massiliensis]
MSHETYGHIECKLSIEIAGNRIDLGYVQVPVTGFPEGHSLRLRANLGEVRDCIQEAFSQSRPTSEKDES